MKWSIFCTLQGIRIVNSAFHQEVINFVLFPTVFLSFSSVIFESSLFLFTSHTANSVHRYLPVLLYPYLFMLCVCLSVGVMGRQDLPYTDPHPYPSLCWCLINNIYFSMQSLCSMLSIKAFNAKTNLALLVISWIFSESSNNAGIMPLCVLISH